MREGAIGARRTASKLLDLEAAAALASACRKQGKRVVVVVSFFDLIGLATARRLESARGEGTALLAAVLGDRAAADRRGVGSPLLGERDRAVVVAALRAVDGAFVLPHGAEERALEALGPITRIAFEDQDPEARLAGARS
jgi:bifunctional ADP-heptose synthase (sugar kinase/adenylyltransferase)